MLIFFKTNIKVDTSIMKIFHTKYFLKEKSSRWFKKNIYMNININIIIIIIIIIIKLLFYAILLAAI